MATSELGFDFCEQEIVTKTKIKEIRGFFHKKHGHFFFIFQVGNLN